VAATTHRGARNRQRCTRGGTQGALRGSVEADGRGGIKLACDRRWGAWESSARTCAPAGRPGVVADRQWLESVDRTGDGGWVGAANMLPAVRNPHGDIRARPLRALGGTQQIVCTTLGMLIIGCTWIMVRRTPSPPLLPGSG
jgi:hypothetical protein